MGGAGGGGQKMDESDADVGGPVTGGFRLPPLPPGAVEVTPLHATAARGTWYQAIIQGV